MKRMLAALVVLAPSVVAADEVLLKTGGRIQGIVVEQTARHVVVEAGPGRVSIAMDRVSRVVTASSALATYRDRAAALAAPDQRGWLALARFARANDLKTQAREAYARVAALDPENAEAQTELGNVRYDGRWMSREESYRAQGLVEFEGAWVSPAEREAVVRTRQAEREARLREAEAEARRAEAEARAREAEARAAEAETGIYGPVYGPYGGVIVPWAVQPCCGRAHAPGACPFGHRVRGSAQPPPPPPIVIRNRDGGRSRGGSSDGPSARRGSSGGARISRPER